MALVYPQANYPFEEDFWLKFYHQENSLTVSLLFYLKENYRGQGIAQKFLEKIEIYLMEKFEMSKYYLNVLKINKRAIHFYKKMGFTVFSEKEESIKMVKKR